MQNHRQCDMEKHQRNCKERPKDAPVVAPKIREAAVAAAVEGRELPPGESDEDLRVECQACGRKFNADRIAVHQRICSTIKAKEVLRKPAPFVKKQQRGVAAGAARNAVKASRAAADHVTEPPKDMTPIPPVAAAARTPVSPRPLTTTAAAPLTAKKTTTEKATRKATTKKSDKDAVWRERSRVTQALIRDAKRQHQLVQSGVPLSDIKPSKEADQAYANLTSDYQPCPHCGRTFAPKAAERHIPNCKTRDPKARNNLKR